MSHLFCPNPVMWQQLYTGPLGAQIDTFAQQLVAQGYASWTAKYTMRLLADLSCWLQRHTLAAMDLNEQRVDEFLQDRYQCYRVHREDRSILSRWLDHLRDQGLIPARVAKARVEPHDRIVHDFQYYLIQQRALAPSTVRYYLDTVRRFLHARFDTQPLTLEALSPQDITDFILQQSRRYSSSRAKLFATALRSFFRFLLQRGAIAQGVIALFQANTGVVSIGIMEGNAHGIEVNRVDLEGHLWCNDGPHQRSSCQFKGARP